jgi:hypothetical protein
MAPVNIIGFVLVAAIAPFLSFLRYLEFSIRRRQQERLAELASLPCPRCGALFGIEAANAARDEGEQRTAESITAAKNRGIRLRVVMFWPVTCRRCGAICMFRSDEGQLAQGTELA